MDFESEMVYYVVQLFGDDKEVAKLGKVGFGFPVGKPFDQSMVDDDIVLPKGGKLYMFKAISEVAFFIKNKETYYPNIVAAVYLIADDYVMKLDCADLIEKPLDASTAQSKDVVLFCI